MDAQGIDVSILALTPPGTHPLTPKDAVALSRTANDVAAATVSSNPSRLRSLSTLPMSSPRDVADELARAAGLGHVGTMVYGRAGELFLDDPVYDEFFSAAAELLKVVLGHWGEMLLFWVDRADSLSRVAGLQRSVSEYLRTNFFITTSGMLSPALLHHALSVTTVDRLIFSTDYPFQRPTREQISSFLEHFSSERERQQFSSANAETLYSLNI